MTAQTRPDELIRILRAEFVTKAGGVPGALCVTFTCGATGWRVVGGTIPRTLVHEVAFQLTAAGNARGNYAIDLQQDQGGVADVAAGDYSAILGGQGNSIVDSGGRSDYSTICSGEFSVLDDAYDCHVHGSYHDISNESYAIHACGEGFTIDDVVYGFFAGEGHSVTGLFVHGNGLGLYSLVESNDFLSNINTDPTYTGMIGVFNITEGDVWFTLLHGEENTAHGLRALPFDDEWVLWSATFGAENHLDNVIHNYLFGWGCKSYDVAHGNYYAGRIVLSGDYPNDWFPDASGYGGGYNQASEFSQSDWITVWPVAWTTSRFELPIIQDSIWYFDIRIVGTEVGCANSYCWTITGVIENDGGNTTILQSTITNIYRDVATKEWQAIADNVNDRLVFQFRDTAGPDATICNIQMQMFTTEVGYNS